MAYENEQIMKAIKALLEATLPGRLDTVEAYWQSEGDALTLPDPVTYHEGYKQTVLELPSSSFPFVSVLVPNRTPTREGAEWGFQESTITAGVHAFVVEADEETVSKMAHRYAEALVLTFQSQQAIAGYRQMNYEPQVSIGVTARHARSGAEGDYFDPAKTDFIRILEVQIELKGG